MPSQRWADATNILCVRLDTLGDVLLTTPALRALKEGRADRQVTLLSSAAGAEVAALVPEIDDAMVHAVPWMKATPPRSDSRAEHELIDQLRRRRFDAAVIFTVFSQNPLPAAMLCYLADIPLRLAHCRENPYQLLSDWVADPEPTGDIRHEVRRQLDLVESIGCRPSQERLSLRVPGEAVERARDLLDGAGLDLDGPWIVVHPGATAASRRYPPEYFAVVARNLVLDHGFQVLFTGAECERELVEGIRSDMGAASHSLVGQLNLPQLSGVLSLAPLLISNNTGPVHVAAALSTPVVDLYALTNPQHTPWETPHRVLSADVPCKYCYKSVCPEGHHGCLRLISPQQVIEATLSLWEETAAHRLPGRWYGVDQPRSRREPVHVYARY